MRFSAATAVGALVKQGQLRLPEQRTVPSVRSWVVSTLADTSPAAHTLRSDLERRVATVAADMASAPLWPHTDEHVLDTVASDLLREFWAAVAALDGNSPATPSATSAGRCSGIRFPDVSRAVYEATTVLGQCARRSPLNADRSYSGDRAGSSDFDTWFVHTVVPAVEADARRRTNRILRRLTDTKPYDLRLVGWCAGNDTKDGQAAQTAFCDLWVTLEATFPETGHVETIEHPVNVKYVAPNAGPGNSLGARGLAWAMLGRTEVPHAAVYRWDTILEELHLDVIEQAVEASLAKPTPDSDYWFLAFEKRTDGTPIGEAWVSSLLTIDPASNALFHNPAQSWPWFQVRYDTAAAARTDPPGTCLEARQRLWNWMNESQRKFILEWVLRLGPGAVAEGVKFPPAHRWDGTVPDGYRLHPNDRVRLDRLRNAC